METDEKRSGLDRSLCIVLRAVPYSEADVILALFSRDLGEISARAYGARSLKSPLRAACQPFCLAEFEFYIRSGRYSLRAAYIRSEFFGIQNSYPKYACACTVLELTERMLPGISDDKQERESLFTLLAVFLQTLDRDPGDPMYLLLFFFTRAVHMLGVFPSLDTCVICGSPVGRSDAWSWSDGGAVCAACAGSMETEQLPSHVLQCLATFGRRQPGSAADRATNRNTVLETLQALQTVLLHQTGISVRAAQLLGQ